jgi:O-antigen/teichoic acid export membrane protein
MIAALLLGRSLGVTGFGQLGLIQTTVLALGSFGEAGLTLTTAKYVGRWRDQNKDRAGSLIAWALLVTLISGIAMSAIMLAVEPYINPAVSLSKEFQIACALLIADMVSRAQQAALSGLEAFDVVARVQVARGLMLLPCVWLGVNAGGLKGALIAMAIVSGITALAGRLLLNKHCRAASISLRRGAFVERPVIMTSASLWFCTLLMTGSAWLVALLLSRHTNGMFEMGVYNAADKWKAVLLFLPNVLFQVVLPMLSNHHEAGNRRECRRIVSMAMWTAAGVTGVAALGVAPFSRTLMSSYGAEFSQGGNVLILAAACAVVMALYTIGSGALWALGKPAQMLGVDLFRTVLLVGLCIGGLGSTAGNVALSYLISAIAGSVALLIMVHRQFAAGD